MDKLEKIFSDIYDQYINQIYRYVFLKVNSKELAQDLTSETFLKVWQYLQKNTNPGIEIKNIKAFLYRIAKNLTIDYYRKKNKTQFVSVEELSLADQKQNLENKFFLNSEIEQIRLALTKLNDDYQNVIIWHYLEGFSIKEVANMLDRTESTTRVLMHRALKALKQKINSV